MATPLLRLPHRRRHPNVRGLLNSDRPARGARHSFVGVLALRPDTGWMPLLSGDTPSATSARMLLPVVVIGPVLLAFLFEAGRKAGLYGLEFRLALTMLATVALLATNAVECCAPGSRGSR
jgi:hypothetical protein